MLDNSFPSQPQKGKSKGTAQNHTSKGVTRNTVGGKTEFETLAGEKLTNSHANALREEAKKNDFKKFYQLTPYEYKPFAHEFYNYYRAEHYIIQQHKQLVESGHMSADKAKKSVKMKLKSLKEKVVESLEEARKDRWEIMAHNAGIDVEQKRSEEAIKNLQALGKKYASIVQNTPKLKEEVWDEKNPKEKSSKLSPAQKAKAKARASRAGRPYPNLVDNMWAANEEYGAGFWATDTLTQNLKADTPGEKGKKRKVVPPEVKEETIDEAYYEKARADQKMIKTRVRTKDGSYKFVWRRQKQPLHIASGKQETQVESVSLNEEDLAKIKKVFYLAQRGMVKSSEIGQFRLIVKKFMENRTLTMNEKDYLLKKYQELLDFILKDDSLTQRFWSLLSSKGFK